MRRPLAAVQVGHHALRDRIRASILQILLLPSFLCLDVPLVALGWSLCLAGDFSPTEDDAALFLAVWGIYLGDRILDATRIEKALDLSPRHEWARRHRGLLLTLAIAVLLIFVLAILPRLPLKTVWSGTVVAMATTAYFLAFRFSQRQPAKLARFPAKEVAIGLTFAAGIGVAATVGELSKAPFVILAGMVLLFTGNCLLIARTEEIWDSRDDVASFYSKRTGFHALPELLLVLSFLVGATEFLRNPGLGPAALVTCVAATWAVSRFPNRRLFQPLADGVLLLPWFLLWIRG